MHRETPGHHRGIGLPPLAAAMPLPNGVLARSRWSLQQLGTATHAGYGRHGRPFAHQGLGKVISSGGLVPPGEEAVERVVAAIGVLCSACNRVISRRVTGRTCPATLRRERHHARHARTGGVRHQTKPLCQPSVGVAQSPALACLAPLDP
jgi:hypothetical protein